MYKSNSFGRAFWVDSNNDFRSCPLFVNNKPDFDQADYVSEWTDLEGLELDKLLNIHKIELISRAKNRPRYDYSVETRYDDEYILTEDVYNEVKKCYNSSNLEDNYSYIDSLLTPGI